MKTKLAACLAFAITACLLHAGAQPESPDDILRGYGKTHWGESVEDVKAAYPGMNETQGDAPRYRNFSVKGSGPVSEIRFNFAADKLFSVKVFFQDEVNKQVGAEYILQHLNEKYSSLIPEKLSVQNTGQVAPRLVQRTGPGLPPPIRTPEPPKLSITLWGDGTSNGKLHDSSNPSLHVIYMRQDILQTARDDYQRQVEDQKKKKAAELNIDSVL
ncbi:MAG: hypothetical protein WCD79_06715 [Chthoniobacteraceae bacterium]